VSASFDPDAIVRLRKFGGDVLLHQMIDAMLAGAPGRIETLRVAVAAGDAGAARAALHSLKSTAGQMGAMAMAELCERGERLAGEGDLAAAAALLPALDAEFAAVHQRLLRIRQGGA